MFILKLEISLMVLCGWDLVYEVINGGMGECKY